MITWVDKGACIILASHFSSFILHLVTWNTTSYIQVPVRTLQLSAPSFRPHINTQVAKKTHTGGLHSSGIQVLCEIHVRKEKSGPEIVPGGIIPIPGGRVGVSESACALLETLFSRLCEVDA